MAKPNETNRAGRPRTFAMPSERLRELAARLEAERRGLGYGAKGARNYYLQACALLGWLERRGVRTIAEVTPENLRAYYRELAARPSANHPERGGALDEKSVRTHVRVGRDLFAMLARTGELEVDPASAVRHERGSRTDTTARAALTQEDVERLYSATQTQRERAVLSLAYGCGLRAAEMVALDVADVRLAEGVVVVERGKGGRRRTVPLAPGVAEDLSDYIAGERVDQLLKAGTRTEAVVVGTRGERTRQWTYNKLLRRLGDRAGLEDESGQPARLTCHVLRHAIATHLLERGLRMAQVQRFLGHALLETTQTYTRVSGELLRGLIAEP